MLTALTQVVTLDINGRQDLDVDGHTNLDNVSIAGVTTFAANARFNSTIKFTMAQQVVEMVNI